MAKTMTIDDFRGRIAEAKVECLICHERMQSLLSHLREVHNLSPKAYRAQFGERTRLSSPIIAELLRRLDRAPQSDRNFEAHVELYTYDPGKDKESLAEAGVAWRKKFGQILPEMTHLIPPIDEYFEFSSNAPEIVDSLLFCKNVMVTGPTGSGKTQELQQVMARMGIPRIRANMHGDVTVKNFLGSKEGDPNRGTFFRYGDLPTAMGYPEGIASRMRPGIPLIVDEVDYTPPHISATMNAPAEEAERSLHLMETGESLLAKPGFTMLATANTGGKGDDVGQYTGTEVLNTSFLDRFSVRLRGSYLPPEKEEEMLVRRFGATDRAHIKKMVQVANEVRVAFQKGEMALTMSTRKLIEYFDQKARKGHDRALDQTLMNWFSTREDYELIASILRRVGVVVTDAGERFS